MKTTKIYAYISLALLCIQLAACKKDKGADTWVSLIGTWKVVSTDAEQVYYVFNEDRTRDELQESQDKRRAVYTTAYKLDGDILNIGGSSIYKVTISGDTLVLAAGNSDTRMIKSPAMTIGDWVKIIEPEYVMNGLFSPAMAFNGSELVAAENAHYAYTKLSFINPVAKYITKTVACAEQYEGLEYTDSKYWGVKDNDEKLYTINGNTGTVISTSIQAGYDLYRIAGSNSTIYCSTYNGRLLKYDIASATFDAGTIIGSFSIGDMAYRSGYLYVVSNEYIYKYNATNLQVEGTYYFKGRYISNLAFDGVGDAWLMAGEEQLLKTQLN